MNLPPVSPAFEKLSPGQMGGCNECMILYLKKGLIVSALSILDLVLTMVPDLPPNQHWGIFGSMRDGAGHVVCPLRWPDMAPEPPADLGK